MDEANKLRPVSALPLVHDSVADIPEDKLVDRLVTDILWGRDFFQFYGMPSGMLNQQCVSLETAPGSPKGDIDILFGAPDLPEKAVAYQVKRIKLGITQLRDGNPSKLGELEKLAQQVNILARMGFWQVYACVIVVVDAREQNAGKVTYQGLSPQMRSKVYSAVSSGMQFFDTRVGFGLMNFTQTADSAPFTVGTHGLDVRRFAQPATQSGELTKWVAHLFQAR
jgi:hypothetical protein